MTVDEILKDEGWSEALYLNERYDEIKTNKINFNCLSDYSEDHKEWISRYIDDENILRRRLKEEQIEYGVFKNIINSKLAYKSHLNASWYKQLMIIFNGKSKSTVEYYLKLDKQNIPFNNFFSPFLKRSIDVMEDTLAKYDQTAINSKKLIGIILKLVMDKIFHLSIKTLIYEINKQRIENKLNGNSAEERYKYFLDTSLGSDSRILSLLSDYPVLARNICESMHSILDNMLLVIDRLLDDRKIIEQKFQIQCNNLNNIEPLGDSHNGGKFVLKITFDSGDSIIYKPRDLAIDEGFNRVLVWLNEKVNNKLFEVMKIINKQDYGWQQFITYKECRSEKEIENFYIRQGKFLGVMYVLNATDMHMENVIAHGEHPFYVDLESLLHNQIFKFSKLKNEKTAFEKTTQILRDSILKTSMLPTLDANALYSSDLSALAGDVDQIMSTYEVENQNTDEIKIKRCKKKIRRSSHLPQLNGHICLANEYLNSIEKGFNSIYTFVMNNKKVFEMLLVNTFKGCNVRTIIRPTIIYFTLVEAATNPKYLKRGVDRNYLFEHIWLMMEQDSSRIESIRYEYKDLMSGDIPFFSAVLGQKKFNHGKNKTLNSIVPRDALEMTVEKIDKMCYEDLTRQWEFIYRTIKTKRLLEETYTMEKIKTGIKLEEVKEESINYIVNNSILLEEAKRIGDYIMSIAVKGDDNETISWISMGMDKDEKLEYKATGLGLYNGIMGIAFFFIYLAKESDEKKYHDAVDLCINSAYDLIDKNIDKNVSVFTGWASVLYVLLHKSIVFETQEYDGQIEELLHKIEDLIDNDEVLDVIGGVAGTLMVCLDIYKYFDMDYALELGKKCGKHLMKNATSKKGGICWVTSTINKEALAGIAHGGSGICLALAKLYSFTNDLKYKNAAIQGLLYENTLYSNKENNWRDMRFSQDEIPEDHYVMYWCNGAPGVGLARCRILEFIKQEFIKTDLENAVIKTLKDGFTEVSYSLCHGDMGNLELLLAATPILPKLQLEQYISSMTRHMFYTVAKEDMHWKCGIPGRQQIPGLMLGLSGIGYQILRIRNRQLPSVLLLDPPYEEYYNKQNGVK